MAKLFRCHDVMPGCESEVRAETEDEILRRAAEHAKEVHGLAALDEAVVKKVKAAIRVQ